MKFLSSILVSLFVMLSGVEASGQNFKTNRPDLVYPVLEEFISGNHDRGTGTLKILQDLDSIVVRSLPLIVSDGRIDKQFGACHRSGDNQWIEIEASLVKFPFEFNKVLKHELSHLFDADHIDTHKLTIDHPLRLEIMSSFHAHYYLERKYEEDPELWKRMNENLYKTLQTKTLPK